MGSWSLQKIKIMPYSDKPLKKHGKEMPAAAMAKGPYMMSGKMQFFFLFWTL